MVPPLGVAVVIVHEPLSITKPAFFLLSLPSSVALLPNYAQLNNAGLDHSDAAWHCKTANGQYNSADLNRDKLAGF
jgi:hypothetical protein